MIFRSRKGRGAVAERSPELAAADEHEAAGRLFEAIDVLRGANRSRRDPEIERRILRLRHTAGRRRAGPPSSAVEHAAPAFDLLPAGRGLPELAPDQLTAELLRAAILRDGCLLVRGLLDPDEATGLAEEIERALQARQAQRSQAPAGDAYFEEFVPDPPFDIHAERGWVTDSGGIWAADSPRVMFEVLEAFERAGLRQLITDYLGERPAISVNKCTLRKVSPDAGNAWHQDGAFLGDVRALNVWLALTRCGDQAPGLDIIPRRIDHIVPTGTEGAIFDWSVSPAVAEEAAGEVAILRPIFEPGDALLFDDLFLHRTAAEPQMPNPRYAVESWFFGPTGFPGEYVPLAF